jgi:D-amino-acid dehydrogenase
MKGCGLMQVAVIGGGVVGVCTAYFLAAAGHEVAVIERHSHVAEQASFGSSGIGAAHDVMSWAAPGMPKKLFSYLLRSESPVILRSKTNRAMWRWIRLWMTECQLEQYRLNKAKTQRIASYSNALLKQLRDYYQLDYEQRQGYLQLFRTERDMRMAEPALALLAEHEILHQKIDADIAHLIEPGLATTTPLAGGIYIPEDESGNCPLFTKQMKNIAQSIGVQFIFNSTLTGIQRENNQVALQVDGQKFTADAVVLAAGTENIQLLGMLGISLPFYPVKTYSATAPINNFDVAPSGSVIDEAFKITIARIGKRIRVSGIAELGSSNLELHDTAIRSLVMAGNDWFPQAANYNKAHFWCGIRPMLPDGLPLLGETPVRGIYVNSGHGSNGWSTAVGSGKLISDMISGNAPDIDMDGLTLSRYKQRSIIT